MFCDEGKTRGEAGDSRCMTLHFQAGLVAPPVCPPCLLT